MGIFTFLQPQSWNNGAQCHLLFGHLGNYRDINPDVTTDAEIWNKKLSNRT